MWLQMGWQTSEWCLSGGPVDLSWTQPDLTTLDTLGMETNDGEQDKRVKRREQRDISNAWFNLKFPW